MSRSKRDQMKRQAAQALNNSAKAILDINSIYDEFKGVHEDKALLLGIIMRNFAQSREQLLVFIQESWALDENQIMSWLA